MTHPDEVRGANGDAPKNATIGAVASSEGRGLGGGMASAGAGPRADSADAVRREDAMLAVLSAAEELESSYRQQHGDGEGGIHPALQSKFHRDTSLVVDLRAAAGLLASLPLMDFAAASDASKAKEETLRSAPAGDGVSDEEIERAAHLLRKGGLDTAGAGLIVRRVLEDFARRRQQSAVTVNDEPWTLHYEKGELGLASIVAPDGEFIVASMSAGVAQRIVERHNRRKSAGLPIADAPKGDIEEFVRWATRDRPVPPGDLLSLAAKCGFERGLAQLAMWELVGRGVLRFTSDYRVEHTPPTPAIEDVSRDR